MERGRRVAFLVMAMLTSSCAAASASTDLVGETSREAILASQARWANAFATTTAPEGASRLAQAPAGASLEVYLGTWCGDSVREVTRLWRALDALGRPPPFTVRLVAVDRQKQAPGGLPLTLAFVPTFVVRRDGAEVGRIVESPPRGLALDLADLLEGRAHGVLSGRPDGGRP